MKIGRSIRKTWLVWLGSLVAVVAMAATFTELTPNIPTVFNKGETQFQNETHFLVFEGSDTAGENAATSKAYYDTIDPPALDTTNKREFKNWLVNAGFISQPSDWSSTGKQLVACDLGSAQGCDLTSAQYNTLAHGGTVIDANGDTLNSTYNIINSDSHVIVLNAADLGFVRNQFIRCNPSCTAPNPKIYTYLENYPVNAFADSHNHSLNGGAGGSGFPVFTGYPTQAEATTAIQSAITRPIPPNLGGTTNANGNCLGGALGGDTGIHCQIFRIADVAFEWAPPATNLSSSTRFGQLYAFLFDVNEAGETVQNISENIAIQPLSPILGVHTVNLATGLLNPNAVQGDPFPPNLDFVGFKEHPGNCFICHGGKPQNPSGDVYPNHGNVNGFRFLPLDNRNLLFTSDSGVGDSTPGLSRLGQEAQIKEYNKAVLLTVNQTPERDDEGNLRPPHLAEVIKGWYAASATDQNMQGNIQNGFWRLSAQSPDSTHDFVPVGWREPAHGGTAPPHSEDLYEQVISPTCRSCHFNRELSTDFGTAANFIAHGSDLLNYVLLPFCQQPGPVDSGFRPMPLAHLTYQRFWQANNSAGRTLPSGAGGPLTIKNVADQLAQYFSYAGAADYCNSIH